MKDQYNRQINYMRISVTNACNYSCLYCEPNGSTGMCSGEYSLTRGDIAMIAEEAAALGIDRFKLTGGEPLMRSDIAEIVDDIKHIPGVRSVTLTTNGYALKSKARLLYEAGLDKVNVSLDTADADRYRYITGVDAFERVLEGVKECSAYMPVRLNSVLMEGINADECIRLTELARKLGVDICFIERMPVGNPTASDTVNNDYIIDRLSKHYAGLRRLDASGNGPAVYYGYGDETSKVGFIGAVHSKFCADCNRIRLMSDGSLKGCLCYEATASLKGILLDDSLDDIMKREKLRDMLRSVIYNKPLMHHFEDAGKMTERAGMKEIGG